MTGEITKTGTLSTTSHKTAGEENMCVRFGYGPLTICNHTWRQVSGLINSDKINMMHTSQQPIKEGLIVELERNFISSKSINWYEKSEYPNTTLSTTFQKPTEEANPYVRFVCIPQKIWNHTQGQGLVSI